MTNSDSAMDISCHEWKERIVGLCCQTRRICKCSGSCHLSASSPIGQVLSFWFLCLPFFWLGRSSIWSLSLKPKTNSFIFFNISFCLFTCHYCWTIELYCTHFHIQIVKFEFEGAQLNMIDST